METFLITNDPLIPTMPRNRPIATKDNHITEEDQLAAFIQFFGAPVARRDQVTPSVTTASTLLQRTLFAYGNLR